MYNLGFSSNSRLCKGALYTSYKELCARYERTELLDHVSTYHDAKAKAADFQTAKRLLFKKCRVAGYGPWVGKPTEEKMFM